MKEKGIGNAFALLGGTQAWKNAGYPLEGEASKKNDSNANANANKIANITSGNKRK